MRASGLSRQPSFFNIIILPPESRGLKWLTHPTNPEGAKPRHVLPRRCVSHLPYLVGGVYVCWEGIGVFRHRPLRRWGVGHSPLRV